MYISEEFYNLNIYGCLSELGNYEYLKDFQMQKRSDDC